MQFFSNISVSLWQILTVFLLSMAPIVELRGAIPVGATFGFPWFETFVISVVGNMIPTPFIILFSRGIFKWLKRTSFLRRFVEKIEKKIANKSDKVMKYSVFGLFIFVMIPLPGTGAWTGALISSFLDIRMRYALVSIFAGVVVAGLIVTGISYGFLSFLRFLI
jgi:uncharacterized membrane protein